MNYSKMRKKNLQSFTPEFCLGVNYSLPRLELAFVSSMARTSVPRVAERLLLLFCLFEIYFSEFILLDTVINSDKYPVKARCICPSLFKFYL